ncbi:MAG TPA: hypothetical protein VJG30_00935 [Candidatus Nanoarchaeia archaeon]|nr:hypothetical protein [Candidatus Nanoarchaeia archaeon]
MSDEQRQLARGISLGKAGQIDIMGLMIVVILIIIGGLFYIKYGVLQDKEMQRDISLDQSYAINLLNSLLNVKVCEETIMIGEAMVECFNEGKICEKEACEYLKPQIEEIIAAVGLKDFKKYSLWIEKGDNVKYITEDCTTGVKADELLKTDDNEDYTVNFRIC